MLIIVQIFRFCILETVPVVSPILCYLAIISYDIVSYFREKNKKQGVPSVISYEASWVTSCTYLNTACTNVRDGFIFTVIGGARNWDRSFCSNPCFIYVAPCCCFSAPWPRRWCWSSSAGIVPRTWMLQAVPPKPVTGYLQEWSPAQWLARCLHTQFIVDMKITKSNQI